MLNLPVQSLEYTDLRAAFVDFLKSDNAYKDFNYDASGVSTQMNLMAYHAHMLGFFVKMLLDESFVDSAHTLQAQRSHAKKTGYVPKGRRAARADVKLSISMSDVDAPVNNLVLIPATASFTGTNTAQDTRVFNVIDDVNATTRSDFGGVVTYTSPEITVYEGTRQTWKFKVDTGVVGQNFVIKDANADLDTIRVKIRPNALSTEFRTFLPARFVDDIAPDSEIYYVTTNEEGFYQIFFGENVYGAQPENGNVIEVTYIACNGESGNGAKTFSFNPPSSAGQPPYHVGHFEDFDVEVVSHSAGGMEPETVDSLRFTIPNHVRRQNRIVTESDYVGILMQEFRNIDSLSVWGGEKAAQVDYGKVYCSIKPRNSQYLTGSAKREISERIVSTFGVVGAEVVFVDPEYIDAEVTVSVKVNKSKTDLGNSEIEATVAQRIWTYSDTKLNKFKTFLSDVEMLNEARADDSFIASLYSSKTLSKDVTVVYGSTGTTTTGFSNPIRAGTLRSSAFTYGDKSIHVRDESGALYLFDGNTKYLPTSVGTIDYDSGAVAFSFPSSARVTGFDELFGVVRFTGEAVNPDVNTSLNNIVRITQVRVKVT